MIAKTARDQLFVNEETHLALELEALKKWIGEPTETKEELVTDPSEEIETTTMTAIDKGQQLEEEAKASN